MYRLGLVYTCCMGPRTKLPLAHLRQSTWQGRQMLIQPCTLHVHEVPVPNSADLQWVSQPSGGQWCSTIFKVPDTFFAACSAFFFLSIFFVVVVTVSTFWHMFYHVQTDWNGASVTSGDKRKGMKKSAREETIFPLLIDQGNARERVKCIYFLNISFMLMKIASWQRPQLYTHWPAPDR